jgi:P-type Mg2+ transporter
VSDDLPGLTSGEARKRLEQCGPNEPVSRRRPSAFAPFGHLFANPLVIILLGASAISAMLGQRVDASIIATIVLLRVSINVWIRTMGTGRFTSLRISISTTRCSIARSLKGAPPGGRSRGATSITSN